MHAVEPLIHEHGFLMVKIATDEFKIYKLPDTGQVPAE
jgi:hypothetical protein